jgi:hypothetical protein
MAGLDPAIPLTEAPPCDNDRDRRVKPGHDATLFSFEPEVDFAGP